MKTLLTAVFNSEIKWTLRSLAVCIVLVLLGGCAPQPGFHFSPSRGSLANEGHARAQSTPLERDEFTTHLPTQDMLADRIPFTATASGKDANRQATINLLSAPERVNIQTGEAKNSVSAQQVKVKQLHKAAKKKDIGKAASEPAVHKLSGISFALSIVGVVLLIIGLAASAALLFLLSFISFIAALITGRKALSQIKKNPEQFSGKGLARAGFIISLIMLLLGVAFILYILAFAGAF